MLLSIFVFILINNDQKCTEVLVFRTKRLDKWLSIIGHRTHKL